jgi:hypothetical protein
MEVVCLILFKYYKFDLFCFQNKDQILWPIASSSLVTIYSWASVSIYFAVVLLVIFLLSGIQLVRFS